MKLSDLREQQYWDAPPAVDPYTVPVDVPPRWRPGMPWFITPEYEDPEGWFNPIEWILPDLLDPIFDPTPLATDDDLRWATPSGRPEFYPPEIPDGWHYNNDPWIWYYNPNSGEWEAIYPNQWDSGQYNWPWEDPNFDLDNLPPAYGIDTVDPQGGDNAPPVLPKGGQGSAPEIPNYQGAG